MNKKAILVSHCVIDEKILQSLHKRKHIQASLGGPVSFYSSFLGKTDYIPYIITSFGSDFKKHYKTELLSYNCNLLAVTPSKQTTRFLITYNTKGKRILKLKALASNLIPQNIQNIPEASFAILSPVYKEISPLLIFEIRDKCSYLSLDPQGFFRNIKADDDTIDITYWYDNDILSCVDILKLSEVEYDHLRINTNKRISIEDLFISTRLKILIITKGKKGCSLYFKKRTKIFQYHIPAISTVQQVDETGAGDIFLAAYTYWFIETKDALKAAHHATAITAEHVESEGLHNFENTQGKQEYLYWLENNSVQLRVFQLEKK